MGGHFHGSDQEFEIRRKPLLGADCVHWMIYATHTRETFHQVVRLGADDLKKVRLPQYGWHVHEDTAVEVVGSDRSTDKEDIRVIFKHTQCERAPGGHGNDIKSM